MVFNAKGGATFDKASGVAKNMPDKIRSVENRLFTVNQILKRLNAIILISFEAQKYQLRLSVKALKNYFIPFFLLITVLGINGRVMASIVLSDTISASVDSVPLRSKNNSGAIDSKVHYTASDSMRFDLDNQKIYLYGNAEVTYEDLNLKAGYMELDMKQNIVFAEGVKDTLGKESELPVFKQGEQNFSSRKMTYNFKTKKGRIVDVDTKEGEGYVHGETVKKDSNSVYYIKNGRYTTCDDPHPHFYIAADKLKVIPNDKIITGPANLVVSDIPTPLAIPFGFFPNKQGRSSGIMIPAYGWAPNRGYFLENGGYYFGMSDYFDVALKGNIYSFGSWAVKSATNYNKRYKFNGNFSLEYSKFFFGDKELPTTIPQKDFLVRWNHVKDPKSYPGIQFSANVDAGTSKYDKYNAVVANQYLRNTRQSNISFSKALFNNLFNFSANARHSQNTIAKTIDISLPEMNLSMRRIYPFKSKLRVQPKWYDKIGLSYNGNFKNSVSTYDSLLFKEETLKKIQNGMSHSVPLSVSLNVLKYFTLTPAVNATSRWYLQTIEKRLDAGDTKKILTDTIRGFKMANDYSLSTALTTNIYGNYYFRKIKLKQIRHVMIPNVGFSYRPDYGEDKYGYYRTVLDSNGLAQKYSIFQNGIYGSPQMGKSSLLNFGLNNNLEMKLRQKSDTGETDKKIVLIESFNLSSSYNMALDSLRWSTVSMNGRTKFFKVLDVNFLATLDPYMKDSKGARINKYQWDNNNNIGRITYADLSLGTSFSNKNKPEDKKDKKKKEPVKKDTGYEAFNIPYVFNVSYKINYFEPKDTTLKKVVQSLAFSGDINATKNWKVGFSSGYDFINKKLTYTSFNIHRDLHCWELKLNVIPFGFQQRFSIDINVKSAVLKDLKISKKRDYFGYQ